MFLINSFVYSSAPASAYLVDDYSPIVAYSVDKISSTATVCCRIRRASDNAEQDIGFSGNVIDDTAVETFVGVGNVAFLVKVYNQGTGSTFYDISKTVATEQPRYVIASNSFNMIDLNLNASKPLTLANTLTFTNAFTVAKINVQSTINYICYGASGGLWYNGTNPAVSGLGGFDGTNARTITGEDLNEHLGYFNMKTSKLFVSKDGNAETDTGAFATSLGATHIGGRNLTNLYMNGEWREMIFFNSDETSNKSAIELDINTRFSIYSTDSDVNAFISATGITDATQKSAINTLVTDLKSYSLWSKMDAIYPMVGGTATTHKYNLKNPLDTDGAFRLTFSGGWTHSSTGALGNGTNTWAETHLIPYNILDRDNSHLSFYSRTDVIGNQTEIGIGSLYLLYRYGSSTYKAFNSLQAQRGSLFAPTTGMLIGSRINSTVEKYYHQGVLTDNLTVNSLAIPSSALSVSVGTNDPGYSQFSAKECAFATIGEGLTDTEANDFETVVQNFQTTLSRNV